MVIVAAVLSELALALRHTIAGNHVTFVA